MRIFFILIIITGAILFLGSCNAPHDNPLDPANPDNSLYSIDGTVVTSDPTAQAISNAQVYWTVDKVYVTTDANGYFKINCKQLKEGWLYFTKGGYNSDSVKITWGTQKKVSIQEKLNDIPIIDSISIYSSIMNKYSLPTNQLVFEITITDKDDNIDSVFVQCPNLQINKSIQKISSTYFNDRFSDIDLDLTSFGEVIGNTFNIYAKTSLGKTYYVGNSTVKRVITDEIETISPKNEDTLTTHFPILSWKRFLEGFNFTYTIEVYTDEPEPKLLWEKKNVSSDNITITVDDSIVVTPDNNKYFWDIWCIDEFGDGSRSKPAGFIIE
ncbi:MAG: carboxypeptidase-like regulatory domain-containing protein [Ignavibacteriaceae bacterium]|nr:carboxypeptidase-like regulatory domain-containing protein [Ignavibacteriaceae bacterium]